MDFLVCRRQKLVAMVIFILLWMVAMTSSMVLPSTHPRYERAAAEGEPVNEPTSEYKPEPNTISEHKPEPNTTSEPEPEVQAETWPEPGPLWAKAFKTWKSAWELHVYLFATCFLVMGLYAAYYVAINIYDGLHKKYLSVSLNAMVFLFCLTRAFVMYLDPYHQGQIIRALQFMRILWSLGGPCLTASDSLIILALLETSRLKITLPILQQAKVISIIITIHFVFVILTDFVVSEYVSAKGMILFCQVFFVVWGFTLGTGYIRLGYVLDKQLFGHKPKKDNQDKLYVGLIYASGIANYFLVLIMLYTVFGVFGVYSDVKHVDAWSWWALQTVLRVSEVITCALIFTVSAKRTRIKKAIDTIATIESQVIQIPELQTAPRDPIVKMRDRLNKQNPSVGPATIDDHTKLGARPGLRRERKMSMFTHLDTQSKAVQGLHLHHARSRGSPTGSIDTQDTIDLEEGLDTNEHQLRNQSPIVMFSKKRAHRNDSKGAILEEFEMSEVTSSHQPSLVRKISAQVRRKISGLSVLSSGSVSDEANRSIIQRNSETSVVFAQGESNLGFVDTTLPNSVMS